MVDMHTVMNIGAIKVSANPGWSDATQRWGKCLASHPMKKARFTAHCNKHDKTFLYSWLPHLVISWHVNIGALLVGRSKYNNTPIKKIHLERRGASHYHPEPVEGRQDCPVVQGIDCKLLSINILSTQHPSTFTIWPIYILPACIFELTISHQSGVVAHIHCCSMHHSMVRVKAQSEFAMQCFVFAATHATLSCI